jgi:hypothetical protein
MRDRTKAGLMSFLLIVLLSTVLNAQTATQVKLVLPTATSQIIAWDFNATDEASIDSFVIQRTAFAPTTTITSPYDQETVIAQKTLRSFTYTLPALVAGQKAFFRLKSRKVGLTDSGPSNVVEIDVVASPPSPSNLRFP